MPKKSCVTNLLEFPEKVTKNTDKGIHTDIVCLDFAKAFDKVSKERLLRWYSQSQIIFFIMYFGYLL